MNISDPASSHPENQSIKTGDAASSGEVALSFSKRGFGGRLLFLCFRWLLSGGSIREGWAQSLNRAYHLCFPSRAPDLQLPEKPGFPICFPLSASLSVFGTASWNAQDTNSLKGNFFIHT